MGSNTLQYILPIDKPIDNYNCIYITQTDDKVNHVKWMNVRVCSDGWMNEWMRVIGLIDRMDQWWPSARPPRRRHNPAPIQLDTIVCVHCAKWRSGYIARLRSNLWSIVLRLESVLLMLLASVLVYTNQRYWWLRSVTLPFRDRIQFTFLTILDLEIQCVHPSSWMEQHFGTKRANEFLCSPQRF